MNLILKMFGQLRHNSASCNLWSLAIEQPMNFPVRDPTRLAIPGDFSDEVAGSFSASPVWRSLPNTVDPSLAYSTLLETVRDVATSTLGVARCCGQLKRSFCYLELNPLAVFNESESTIGVTTAVATNRLSFRNTFLEKFVSSLANRRLYHKEFIFLHAS